MTPLLAYFGPETVLPATSIVATILGVALMLGKNSLRWGVGLVKTAVDACLRRKASPGASNTTTKAPHFAKTARPRVKDDVTAR
ncbi:hypothetical protein [Planctomyces sp. SH-PL62]|uniref:hypothetical protein n=1 Tax=Planctomyces sp. SH-PL62 TaxID=1636152 RepID=UPI00078C1674|nr:hypothetical protein [Planctomyces sp. SH-PL62]AMV40584.1 hypothetical protein VT85_24350 [Planctomyces sp. SH-PL62]